MKKTECTHIAERGFSLNISSIKLKINIIRKMILLILLIYKTNNEAYLTILIIEKSSQIVYNILIIVYGRVSKNVVYNQQIRFRFKTNIGI